MRGLHRRHRLRTRSGCRRAVATCGTALTEEHVKLLNSFANRIVLAFDADAAGQAAAERFYEWEQRYEIEVAVADLPAGVDPADLAARRPRRRCARRSPTPSPFLAFRLDRVLDGGRPAHAGGPGAGRRGRRWR